MGEDRLGLLKGVLLLKVIVTFLAWGLPALFAPVSVVSFFGLVPPEDPVFMRFFGVAAVALGVAYWYAYRDPVRNIAIVKVGIVDNGLATLTIIALGMTGGVESWFIWASSVLTAFFCFSFMALMPRGQGQRQA